MSFFATARTIYVALKDDQNAIDAIRAERAALALKLATDQQGSFVVTSGTMNGQTFSGMTGITPKQRLYVLSAVCKMADNDQVASSTTQPYL